MLEILTRCFQSQRLYGKQPEDLAGAMQVFNLVLADYCYEQIEQAFKVYLMRHDEMPTPADIAKLIRNKGRKNIPESVYVTLSKKAPELRNQEEWNTIQAFEHQYNDNGGWEDDLRTNEIQVENVRLRQEVKNLKAEIRRLGNVVPKRQQADVTNASAKTDKIQATIDWMKEAGASKEDIEQFLQENLTK